MKLNDPFDRVARKQQRGYQAFREQLRDAGIHDLDRLEGFRRKIDQMLLKFTALVVVAGIVSALLLPGLAGAALVFGGLVLLWLLVNHLQTRGYARRFQAELERDKSADGQ